MAAQQSSPKGPLLPGFDLPINCRYPRKLRGNRSLFAHALEEKSFIYTLREITMMSIMDSITDKPDWDRKVFDEEITSKWRTEIADSDRDVSEKMVDCIIQELQWKAEEYQRTGYVECFDPGVVKSDTAVSSDLQNALKKAVRPLEDVPPEERDYHPGSDEKVVDLVHPSLFPVIYGRTKVLVDRRIGLDDCFMSIGQGESTMYPNIPGDQPPPNLKIGDTWKSQSSTHGFSKRFQWLPCDVRFTPDGECEVASYINNLHPHKHRDLYRVIDQILTQTIPLWDRVLEWRGHLRRIFYHEAIYIDENKPQQRPDEGNHEFWERYDEWRDQRPVVQPEPRDFKPSPKPRRGWLDLRKGCRDHGLQVIVKLANIELTPEKPEYGGGTWHIEAQLNERICATAIYYYDCENVTENKLAFRHRADHEYIEEEVSYPQSEHTFLPAIFGIDVDAVGDDDYRITQDLGAVTCREGRLLAFPNTLQHCVSPFALEDRSRRGHRKIMAFFLIDPNRRTISSANVPPQREDWCQEWQDSVFEVLSRRLPRELQEMVVETVDSPWLTLEEAKEYRRELMDERSVLSVEQNRAFELGGFSLCEH